MDSLAKRIAEIMRHFDLSPKEMADKCGVQRSGLSHILNQRNKPSIGFITSLTEAFPTIDPNWLLHGKGTMFTSVSNDGAIVEIIPERPVLSGHEVDTNVSEVGKDTPRLISSKRGKISRIIVFYDDGTFEEFNSRN